MNGELALVLVATLPLVGALLTVLFGLRGGFIALAVAASISIALFVLILDVAQGGVIEIAVGGWEAPLGITLRADGLALAFLTMSALVMVAVILFAQGGFAPRTIAGKMVEKRASYAFWPLALLLWAALNAIFLSRDLFNIYVGLEMLTLAAMALVAIGGKAESIAAAMRCMMFALLGSLLYLLGVSLLYAAHGTLDIDQIFARTTTANADFVAAGLITAGLLLKTALFPFHAWLPPAHSNAPAPASAMLSALVPKASFYILLRFWFEAVPDLANQAVMWFLGGLGALAILFGSLMALRQMRLKLIIAYSTVAQIGYLFLVFPLAGGDYSAQPWATNAWSAASFHAISHGLAKAAMFLCAGLWIVAVGHDRLDGMKGLAQAMPMTTFAFVLAAMTLIGLPPSGGFTAKYLMLSAAFSAGDIIWVVILVAGGLLSAAYLYRPIAFIFERKALQTTVFVSHRLQAIPLILALAATLLGLASNIPFELLQIGRPFASSGEME